MRRACGLLTASSLGRRSKCSVSGPPRITNRRRRICTDYTGYVATAMDLKKRFNAMRAILDVNLVKFKASGNGDGKLDPAVEAVLINNNKYPKVISNMEFK